ncbi:hypothetical protein GCM10028794_13130 [Silanimonas algicola]
MNSRSGERARKDGGEAGGFGETGEDTEAPEKRRSLGRHAVRGRGRATAGLRNGFDHGRQGPRYPEGRGRSDAMW